jgi:hypothetical protein
MQENAKAHRNSLLRKIVTIVFLPIIIIIWITGWTLTQIGDQREPTKINQKTLQTCPGFKAHQKESKATEEDSRIANEPIIT